ncbi:hypothetical protein ACTIGL_21710 [Bacillus shihchuchen]|uniref:Uncharacterized protein n=1 Tax=Bacillus shihchuchen TaxID=3036942 RepID=A0ABT7KY58_9BACI|nr:hypothetical protein [Bacillus shihchuchen]
MRNCFSIISQLYFIFFEDINVRIIKIRKFRKIKRRRNGETNFSIILTVLSVFMIFFINSPSASATENITNGDLKQKYNEGIKDGAIDKSITYEQWEKVVAENEKALEKIKKIKLKGSYKRFRLARGLLSRIQYKKR